MGKYYVLQGSDDKVIETSLYRDENISINIEFFSGHISRLIFLNLDQSQKLDFEISSIQHDVNLNGTHAEFESEQGCEPKSLDLSKNPLYICEKRYKLEKLPKVAVESIHMSVIINSTKVDISKEFSLRRVTYNYFQAMQGI